MTKLTQRREERGILRVVAVVTALVLAVSVVIFSRLEGWTIAQAAYFEVGSTLSSLSSAVLVKSGDMGVAHGRGRARLRFSASCSRRARAPSDRVLFLPRRFGPQVITLTTIGYGDYVPSTTAGKLTACVLILVGVTGIGASLGFFISSAVDVEASACAGGRLVVMRHTAVRRVSRRGSKDHQSSSCRRRRHGGE